MFKNKKFLDILSCFFVFLGVIFLLYNYVFLTFGYSNIEAQKQFIIDYSKYGDSLDPKDYSDNTYKIKNYFRSN